MNGNLLSAERLLPLLSVLVVHSSHWCDLTSATVYGANAVAALSEGGKLHF